MKLLIVAIPSGVLLLTAVLAFRSSEITSGAKAGFTPFDPRVEAMVQPYSKCPDANETYTWICGSVLKMPGLTPAKTCTSKEEPLFTGTLSLPGQDFFYGETLLLNYALPLAPLVPCAESWPESSHSCARILLFPKKNNVLGRFNEAPPDPLPRDFPSPPFDSSGHTLEPNFFAEFDDMPVALNYTRWIGKKPGAAPDVCRLETRISALDVGIELSLPCAKMGRWRDELGSLVTAIEAGILSSDRSATCENPPAETVFLLNKYHPIEIESMSEWLDLNR